MKFYIKVTGLKTPDILINDDYWYERCDNETCIGFRRDEATNTNKEYLIEDEYVHHIFDAKFMDRFRHRCNHFIKLPRHIKLYLTRQCLLWENQVQVHKITRNVIAEANSTTKTEEVSEYK